MAALRIPCIGLALLAAACSERAPNRRQLDVREALAGGAITGFERALAPQPFVFPRDHGAHPRFRTEWWYFTGNLQAEDGRWFGYQLTFFRNALTPEPKPRSSEWASNQIYMAHFALTDVTGKRFRSFERFARNGLELAGARAAPFRVWLEDWSVSSISGDFLPLRLQVHEAGITLALELRSTKPLVLQGDRGLSRKSSTAGNASYYYSYSRLSTRGEIRVGKRAHEVHGASWMDREWSTSALGDDQVGWDWFALQLDNDCELMFYRLRRRDGSADPVSSGAIIAADGSVTRLALADVKLRALTFWTSPASGARYPQRFELRVPAHGIDLEVEPVLAGQELENSFRYWEGAVRASGTWKRTSVAGRGYVELTGYEPD